MPKSIVVIGTLDTKGDQLEYIRKAIEWRGKKVILVDIGVLGQTTCDPEITNKQVAQAGGTTIEELIALKDEAKAMDKMTEGALKIIKDLHEKQNFDGILAAGGSMGTSSALKIMNELSLDLPKVMLSTLAYSHAIDPDLAANGIIMIQWAGGLWGINDVVRKILEQTAAVISAAADAYEKQDTVKKKKTICITSLGASGSIFLKTLKPELEERNIDAVVYHSTGMNTRVMERAIREGYFDAVLDFNADMELMGYVSGSLFGAAPSRMEAAAEKGLPQIVLLGHPLGDGACLWAPFKPIPPEFENNMRFVHNDLLWPLSVNTEQTIEMTKLMATKLNMSKGPTALLVLTKGANFQEHTAGGANAVSDKPELMKTMLKILKENLKPDINLIELDMTAYDPELSSEIIKILDEMMPKETM